MLISIHAALAGIFHMSGAERFFDELFNKYRDSNGNAPAVKSWAEWESMMDIETLRDFATEAFRGVEV